jgi:hypothetical protein
MVLASKAVQHGASTLLIVIVVTALVVAGLVVLGFFLSLIGRSLLNGVRQASAKVHIAAFGIPAFLMALEMVSPGARLGIVVLSSAGAGAVVWLIAMFVTNHESGDWN